MNQRPTSSTLDVYETAEQQKGDSSIGRIVSVTGSKAIVLLDDQIDGRGMSMADRPEMGTLLAISQANTIVLAIVSALSVPVPAHTGEDREIWIAELGLVGELWVNDKGVPSAFNRGVTSYPALGDRVRVASKTELRYAFCGNSTGAVRVGSIRQDDTIPAMVKVDDLLGKHFAILGTTGTGKSCTTALILRSILQDNPNAHIVLLDPHNEYATAFGSWAEVMSPRNMQLPYWLLNFEEIIEVLIGDTTGRKAEVEILQELIPMAKSRYGSGRNGKEAPSSVRRGGDQSGRFTVDTPVPYRMSDLLGLIDERMGKLENKRDLQPYRQLRSRIEGISRDARYSFMFGNVTVSDGMAKILGRIFRVPVNNRPITILELTGLPTEIVNVVVSVLCRMTFDFALWGEGHIPVTLVCEEAHRYVPAKSDSGFEPCKRAIAKIAKEGRKYGASLCIVTQRPAEIDPTILSQCNTVFALRMSNDRDQQIVQSAVSDTGSGLLEFLPALGQREAIAFGDGVALPVRIRFDELAKDCLPRSSTARFSEKWQNSIGDDDFLEHIVERWRSSGGLDSEDEDNSEIAMLADTMETPSTRREQAAAHGNATRDNGGQRSQIGNGLRRLAADEGVAPAAAPAMARNEVRPTSLRRDMQAAGPERTRPSLDRAPLPERLDRPAPSHVEPEPAHQARTPAPQQPEMVAAEPGTPTSDGRATIPRAPRSAAAAGVPRVARKPAAEPADQANALATLRQRLMGRSASN